MDISAFLCSANLNIAIKGSKSDLTHPHVHFAIIHAYEEAEELRKSKVNIGEQMY
jgi:hypothetical protein